MRAGRRALERRSQEEKGMMRPIYRQGEGGGVSERVLQMAEEAAACGVHVDIRACEAA
jgi:hypothetical protein